MNLYWPVYKNLEKELLNLAEVIHFDDKQINTYSMHIADLLVRVAVEIEAIARDLYKENGGNMNLCDDNGNPRHPFFDTDCLEFLNDKWSITNKTIRIASPIFYIEKDENRILKPLKNCNKRRQGKWKNAYQAVKHDRVESLDKGTIKNLIHAMAALYVLNLYKKDEKAELGLTEEFDARCGSEVFSVGVFRATTLRMDTHMNDENIEKQPVSEKNTPLDDAVYINKYTDTSFIEMNKQYIKDLAITEENFQKSAVINEYLSEHPEERVLSITEICMNAGAEKEKKKMGIGTKKELSQKEEEAIKEAGFQLIRQIVSFQHQSTGKKVKQEFVLNKSQQIYPAI